MTWEEKEAKFGKPWRGQVYDCKIQNYRTGKVIEQALKCVNEDDCMWRDADGHEIDEWNWDVIEWVIKKT